MSMTTREFKYPDGVSGRNNWHVYRRGEWLGMVVAETRAEARWDAVDRYGGRRKGEAAELCVRHASKVW